MHNLLSQRSTIRVTALQLLAHDRNNFTSVWPRILESIEQACSGGTQLLVLPEGTVPAYVLGNRPVDADEVERAVADVQECARRAGCVIIFGAARVYQGKTFNSAYIIDSDGHIAGTTDKFFLWHFDRKWFEKGTVLEPVPTSLGKLGVMICADGRIPLIARRLVERGASILVMPTAWVTTGRNPGELENVQADLLAPIRARENHVPLIAANKVGVEAQCVAYCGKSQILERDGSVIALASQCAPQMLSALIELHNDRVLPTVHHAPLKFQRAPKASLRIAIALDTRALKTKLAQIVCNTDAEVVVGPDRLGENALRERGVAVAYVADETVLDPRGLVAHKEAGCQLIIWETRSDTPWQTRFARARALELRLYVLVLDTAAGRAYAVDPDGTVLCGTFQEYRVAAFQFNAHRTLETIVAPFTDILDGLSRASQTSWETYA